MLLLQIGQSSQSVTLNTLEDTAMPSFCQKIQYDLFGRLKKEAKIFIFLSQEFWTDFTGRSRRRKKVTRKISNRAEKISFRGINLDCLQKRSGKRGFYLLPFKKRKKTSLQERFENPLWKTGGRFIS